MAANKSCKTGSHTLKDNNQKSECLGLTILGLKLATFASFEHFA